MSDNLSIITRLSELADRSYNNNQYTFSNFLSQGEISEYYTMERKLQFAGPKLYGGTDIAERKVVRFGNPESLGYEEEFPIVSLLITPVMAKFSDTLTHRDFLGSLMNLGIKRELVGDIFVKNNEACVFCLESIADYITDNLSNVKHTTVKVTKSEDVSFITTPTLEEKIIRVVSERADAVVSKTFNMSRGDSLDLFRQELIFINGRICTDNAKILKSGDTISVRGYGKFSLAEIMNVNKKGKLNVKVMIYK